MSIYEERKHCIFCNSDSLDTLLNENLKAPTSFSLYNKKEIGKENNKFMPYNIQCCNQCNSCQNKYVADLNLVYNKNHMDNYGSTKNRKFNLFSNFIYYFFKFS